MESPANKKQTGEKKYWLIKSEPTTYSIDHLKTDGSTPWTGIRNYQARNYMRDSMKVGDLCLFYHSSAKEAKDIGAAGIAKVASKPYPDPTARDKKSDYFEKNPKIIWDLVDIKFVKKFPRLVPLSEIKNDPKLAGILVAKKGMRLSIQPVSEKDFLYIEKRGAEGAPLKG